MTSPEVQLLIIEDNPVDAELMLASIELPHGIASVHVARDGLDALDFLFCRGGYADRASSALPRLVILDVKLPKVDGFAVLREIRADPRTQMLPVVMLTSSAIERDVVQGYRLGANSYVQKPMEVDEFRETVRQLGHYWLRMNAPLPASALAPAQS
jgi:two-component system response regulator